MYHGYRFPPEIIGHAIWLYHRFCLSFRDIKDLLAERGVVVSYETIISEALAIWRKMHYDNRNNTTPIS